MLLSDAFDAYIRNELLFKGQSDKTRRNYLTTCNSLVKSVTDLPIELLMVDHIVRWKMNREAIGHATSTISHDLSRLKAVLKFLRKHGHNVLDEEFIDLPKIKEKPYTWLDYGEVQKLLDVIDSARDKAIVACLFATGCRITELLNLNREDIRGRQAEIIGKGDVIGTVYFDDTALGLLQAYLDTRRDHLRPLFVSSQHRRITASRVGQLLHDYQDAAGIDKNLTPHVLRHSFATDMKLNGADIFDIQKQLRHKRISSTQIYTHINDKQKEEAYNKYHSH